MRVAVTGASGFIGTALCAELARVGHLPVTLDVQYEAVVHLAAIAHRRASAQELQRVNVDLALNVGRAAAAAGCAMIYMSSLKVHGEASAAPLTATSPLAPADAYATSKARAEEALRGVSGLRLTVLRPPLVYGPGVKANFLALMRAIDRGVPLPLAAVANRRSAVYVGNLVDAIVRCLAQNGGTHLVADGAPLSTPELCRAIGEALERPARLFPFPPSLLPVASLRRTLEIDADAAQRQLGWQPRFTLREGLHATAAWYRRR